METYYLALMNKMINVLAEEVVYLAEKIKAIDDLAAFTDAKLDWSNFSDKKKIEIGRSFCGDIHIYYAEVLNRHSNKEEK